MKHARPLLLTLTALATAGALASCSSTPEGEGPLQVLAASTPHAEILEWVDENDDTFELDIKVVTGGPEVNAALVDGSAPLNFFQHEPYLLDWQEQTGQTGVEVLAPIHIEPMSLYSARYGDLADIPEGSTITLPRSASNFARGLLLLQDHGVITLDTDADPAAISQITVESVADNPRNLDLVPIEDDLAARSLDDSSVAAAVISSNFALEAGLDPVGGALITEDAEGNPYANILVASAGAVDDERVAALTGAITSAATADWIRERFGSAVVPVTDSGAISG
ncbi:ABC transporter substrate-binding protein [Corynebacterium hylobatis]|uniref:ABC transporter substrate-binding protein n=1 Tax=Corynebacterium hylobatis TaxID=1859290 RepID=A0A3R9ZFA4_9CORY|nr:MetQ/NlpA family ABC transporter substrate-binding protein [Corynebacterium hylobatis]RSZ65620.1 ABC transporter substrate-binding protein [Corynebacterium hylobatis]